MSSYCNRIYPVVGAGTMTSLSLHGYGKIICRRSADSRIADNNRSGRKRHSGHHMNHQCSIHLWILQQSILNHVIGTFKYFLCRLEHQLYSSANVRFLLLQYSSRTKQHGCMHIMSTGVHASIHRRIIHIRFFLYLKAIHICTKQENLSRLFTSHGCHKTCSATSLGFIPHLFKLFFHIFQGVFDSKPDSRVGMQKTPVCKNCVFMILCQLHNFSHFNQASNLFYIAKITPILYQRGCLFFQPYSLYHNLLCIKLAK